MKFIRKIIKLKWLPIRYWFYIRQAMMLKVRRKDPLNQTTYKFVAGSLHSYQRAIEALSKEPETLNWLRDSLKPDDTFLDIGANVGTFTIFAATQISNGGHVYACEPHLPTAVQLLQNIALNNLEHRVSVLSIATSDQDKFVPFRYKRWREGASGSQLSLAGAPTLENPVGVELKPSYCVDTLIELNAISSPNLIKIDTDGTELHILRGMEKLLKGTIKPRSVLVEAQIGESEQQEQFMATCGYKIVARHVEGKFRSGTNFHELAHNAIYEQT